MPARRLVSAFRLAMYDLHDYARMIADKGRMGPYVGALQEVVRPGMVIADIGTGTGILALLACRLGARRVYAIDTNDAIRVAKELAVENGFADRIVFFQGDAREFELPERADVILSDLRGVVPLYREHLAIIVYARERFLKPGGLLVPARDRLMVAVVDRPDLHEWGLGPGRAPQGITLEAMRARLINATFAIRESSHLVAADVLSEACAWATLEYRTVQVAPLQGRVALRVNRAGVGHGLVVWFEATLAEGHGFSNAPGQDVSYGQLFLPWPSPVQLHEGDSVRIELWAQAEGDPWGWNSTVLAAGETRAAFKQSSFLSLAARPAARTAAVP